MSQFVEVRDPIIFVVSCAGAYIIKRCTAVLANPGNVGEREGGGGGRRANSTTVLGEDPSP